MIQYDHSYAKHKYELSASLKSSRGTFSDAFFLLNDTSNDTN